MPGPEIEFHEPVRTGGTRRVAASRFGILAAAAALMLVGVVAVVAAAPAPATGADPSAASGPKASAAAPNASGAPHNGNNGRNGGQPGVRGPLGRFAPAAGGLGAFGLGGLGRGGIGFGAITVTAIDGSKLSLDTADGWTRTITVTGSTTITKAGKTIALGDLAVGDHIRFAQQRESSGSYTITRIVVALPSIAGEVTAVNGNTITVKQRGGTNATIHVDASTTYRVNGADGTLKDVKVGSIVVAAGTQRTDGSLDAA